MAMYAYLLRQRAAQAALRMPAGPAVHPHVAAPSWAVVESTPIERAVQSLIEKPCRAEMPLQRAMWKPWLSPTLVGSYGQAVPLTHVQQVNSSCTLASVIRGEPLG